MPKSKRTTKAGPGAKVERVSDVKTARTSKDTPLVTSLSTTGMPKGVARTLSTLSTAADWLTSKDIERATRLRQPEVSIAVRELMARGWIQQDALREGAKGRPVYIYRMAADLKKVFEDIREREAQRIGAIEGNLDSIASAWGVK
jgi:predicted transcriptional regulator